MKSLHEGKPEGYERDYYYITALMGHASVLHAVGNDAAAKDEYANALRLAKTHLGTKSYWTASCAGNYAKHVGYMGLTDELKEVTIVLDECEENMRFQFGTDHRQVLTMGQNLASCYTLLGQFDKAIPIWERVVADTAESRGADHKTTLLRTEYLADCLEKANRMKQAADLYSEVYEMHGKLDGKSSKDARRLWSSMRRSQLWGAMNSVRELA